MVIMAGVLIALVSYLGSWIGLALHGHPTPPAGVTVPDSTFFGGQLVFEQETYVTRLLHNFTVFGMQRELFRKGMPFFLLPIRV
jgi:hypothetical protein